MTSALRDILNGWILQGYYPKKRKVLQITPSSWFDFHFQLCGPSKPSSVHLTISTSTGFQHPPSIPPWHSMAPASLRWHGEPWPLGRGPGGADIGSLTHIGPVHRDKLLGHNERTRVKITEQHKRSSCIITVYPPTLTVLLTGRYANWPRDIIDRAYIDRFQFLAVQRHWLNPPEAQHSACNQSANTNNKVPIRLLIRH